MGKFAFFEICSGTGSMSRAASIVQFKQSYSMDILPSMDPDYICDITDPASLEPVVAQIEHLKSQGYFLAFHFSPPCNAYSRMQKCHPISDKLLAKKIELANKLVNAGLTFMELHGDAWTLENPQTGKLWRQPDGTFVCDLSHFVDLDYCPYGGAMMKCTRFAFSCFGLKQEFGAPKRCNPLTCDSMFVNDETGRRIHQSIQDEPDYFARIKIPDQLAIKVTSSIKMYLQTLAPKPESGDDAGGLPLPAMLERKKVIAYKMLQRGRATFKLTRSPNWVEMGADAALAHPWAELALLHKYCKRVNTYVFRRVLQRVGDEVQVEWRDYPDPTWEPAAEYEGKQGCGDGGGVAPMASSDEEEDEAE